MNTEYNFGDGSQWNATQWSESYKPPQSAQRNTLRNVGATTAVLLALMPHGTNAQEADNTIYLPLLQAPDQTRVERFILSGGRRHCVSNPTIGEICVNNPRNETVGSGGGSFQLVWRVDTEYTSNTGVRSDRIHEESKLADRVFLTVDPPRVIFDCKKLGVDDPAIACVGPVGWTSE